MRRRSQGRQRQGLRLRLAVNAGKIVWDVALLQKWLTKPEALISGQRMGYSVDDAKDRVDLAEYLATLK